MCRKYQIYDSFLASQSIIVFRYFNKKQKTLRFFCVDSKFHLIFSFCLKDFLYRFLYFKSADDKFFHYLVEVFLLFFLVYFFLCLDINL